MILQEILYPTNLEIWKNFPGYEGLYTVSTFGNVKSLITGKVLSPWINNRGYLCIKLYKNGYRHEYKVHQLVGLTYRADERTFSKKEINHKDRNRLNNHVNNVEWCTRKRNIAYKYLIIKQVDKGYEEVQGPF